MRSARTRGRMLAAAGAVLAIAGLARRLHRRHRRGRTSSTRAPRRREHRDRRHRRHRLLGPRGRPRLARRHQLRRHRRGRELRRRRTAASPRARTTRTRRSPVETFINDGVDAIVLLPTDGAALTEVAIKAMEAGIPVINVDREFSSPFAARATDPRRQLRHGRQRRHVHLRAARRQPRRHRRRDRRHRLAAAHAGPLARLRRRARGLRTRGRARVAADFTVQGGEAAASQLLSANPQIDALWNHDDDQGVGVLAAIEAAGRDEFFMVGGAGSKNAMEAIEADDTVLEGDGHLPVDAGCRRHRARPPHRAGQDDGRPDHAGCRTASCSTRRS